MSSAEMVIRLLDGSEQSSPNYLPDGTQNVPTVDSVSPRNQIPAATPGEATEPKPVLHEVSPQPQNYLTNTAFIDSMEEFTRRIEHAIELSRTRRQSGELPRESTASSPEPADNSEATTALNSAVDAIRRFSPKWLGSMVEDMQKLIESAGSKTSETKQIPSASNPPTGVPSTNSVGTVGEFSDSIARSGQAIAESIDETNRRLQAIADSIGREPVSAPTEQRLATEPTETLQSPSQPRSMWRRVSQRVGRAVRYAADNTKVGRASKAVAKHAMPRVKAIANRLPKMPKRSVSTASSASVRNAAGSFLARAGAGAATAGTAAGAGAGAASAGGSATASTAVAGGAAVGGGALAAGAVVALPVAALAALAASAYGAKKAFDEAAEEIERFSPGVAYQRSRARANTEINMLERSRAIGGTVSQLESSRTHFQDSTERLWTRILSLLETFSPLITKTTDSLSLLVDFAAAGIASLDVIKSRITLGEEDDKEADRAFSQAKARVDDSWSKLFSGAQRKANPHTFDEMFERFRRSVENDKR